MSFDKISVDETCNKNCFNLDDGNKNLQMFHLKSVFQLGNAENKRYLH